MTSILLAIYLLIAIFASTGEATAGIFKNGMLYGLSDIDQRGTRCCSGKLEGLNDENGKTILPRIYSDIEWSGHGIFLATDVQKWNKYYFGDTRHFFNRDGIELPYKLPEKAFLLNILSFGSAGDNDPGLVLDQLPPDAILIFEYRGEPEARQVGHAVQGLCNINGDILFKPVPGEILFLEPGVAFVDRHERARTFLKFKDMTETPTSLQRESDKFPPPRIDTTVGPYNLPLLSDRSVTRVSTDDGRFDHYYWCDKRSFPIPAIDMFNRFLHEYDLIGMRADKVDVLLNEPEKDSRRPNHSITRFYSFPRIGCIPHFEGIKMYIENERVIAWSFEEGDPLHGMDDHWESPKITINVVLKRNLKRIDVQPGFQRYWDDLVPKH